MTFEVDPGQLRLPPDRADGPDPFRLADQIREFGTSDEGMPPLQLTQGQGGEYMINDGVTRATRIYLSNPGRKVRAEVIHATDWDLTHLPRVKDVML